MESAIPLLKSMLTYLREADLTYIPRYRKSTHGDRARRMEVCPVRTERAPEFSFFFVSFAFFQNLPFFLFEIFTGVSLVHRTPSKDNTGVVETSTIRRGLVKPVNLSSRYVNVGSPAKIC